MFIINVQNIWDQNIQFRMSAATSTRRSDKTEAEERLWEWRWFWADSQSDCSKNMPPLNMQNISCSLTNRFADILYVDDNKILRCRQYRCQQTFSFIVSSVLARDFTRNLFVSSIFVLWGKESPIHFSVWKSLILFMMVESASPMKIESHQLQWKL